MSIFIGTMWFTQVDWIKATSDKQIVTMQIKIYNNLWYTRNEINARPISTHSIQNTILKKYLLLFNHLRLILCISLKCHVTFTKNVLSHFNGFIFSYIFLSYLYPMRFILKDFKQICYCNRQLWNFLELYIYLVIFKVTTILNVLLR